MKSIETIEQELYGWTQSVELRAIVARQLKRSLADKILEEKQRKKQINRELRALRSEVGLRNRVLNRAKRDLKEAKDKVQYWKSKKSRHSWELKNWTNRNFGKMISKIEEVDNGRV